MQRIKFLSPARKITVFWVAAWVLAVSGCSAVSTYLPNIQQFGAYKPDINQGNFLTEDMINRLKEGQTRQQVRAILGTPLLDDAFHPDRWDYIYSYTKNGREIESRKFVVFFEKDLLSKWEGDKMPVSEVELNRIAAARALPNDPSANDRGFFAWLFDLFSGDE
ncbi:MAG: outer membrane protein assembly factor BamE [Burkholderiales bacterium]|jgi:outer membrane protein assembly factor BamE|nr:outer membrane protein assembly factor BamE [Burkholderiales bacterium]